MAGWLESAGVLLKAFSEGRLLERVIGLDWAGSERLVERRLWWKAVANW